MRFTSYQLLGGATASIQMLAWKSQGQSDHRRSAWIQRTRPESMDSPTSPPDSVKKALLEEGFTDLSDSKVGEHVWEFEQKRFPFYTKDGMDFLMQHILGDPVSRSQYSEATSNLMSGR